MQTSIFFVFCFIVLAHSASELVVDFEFEGVAPVCCPVPPPTCGDGVCEAPAEGCADSRFPCRLDCDCGALCGDEKCQEPENCTSCPGDCGACPVCGNLVCEDPEESCVNCNTDCGRCVVCGDKRCELDEDCNTCSADCGICPAGVVQGRIVDAISGHPIFNASVQLYINGKPHAMLYTDNSGYFMYMAAPIPYAVFKIMAPGYYDAWTQVQVIQGYTNRFIRGMSPLLQRGQWRAVLTWLDQPLDLDLTLFGDYDEEIYDNGVCDWEYIIKNQSLPWAGYTSGDITESLGPESILILEAPSDSPPLEFWVHNYSGDRTNPSELLRNSTAVVWLFNFYGQQGEWTVPRDAPVDALWWHVFNIRAGKYIDNVNEYFPGSSADCEYTYCPWSPA